MNQGRRTGIGLVVGILASAGMAGWADTGEDIFRKVDSMVVAIQHEQAAGSGFIVDGRGFILTNGHVVSRGDQEDPKETTKRITVILHNDRKYQAKVMGFSMDPDVALLKIEPEGEALKAAVFGDSSQVKPGQVCYAFGTPYGLKRTLTRGIVSNVERTDLGTFTKVFQTDAAINPGNSGGPLFNEQGEVIGVNTYSGGGGLGFTIPIHIVKVLCQHLMTHGRFIRADLPLMMTKAMTEEFAKALGTPQGVFVDFVEGGSSADRAGMAAGDVIIEVDGRPVSGKTEAEYLDFTWQIATREVKSQVTLTVMRPAGKTYQRCTVKATLEEDEPAIAYGHQRGELREIRYDSLGVGVQQLTKTGRYLLNLPLVDGVRVTTVMRAKPAQIAGFRVNDVITAVNDHGVGDPAQLEAAMDQELMKQQKFLVATIRRGNDIRKVVMKPPYELKGRRIFLVAAPQSEFADLLKRGLSLSGGTVLVMDPGRAWSAKDCDAVVVASLKELMPSLKTALGEMVKEKKFIGAIGETPLWLLGLDESLLAKKITMTKDVSSEALKKKANYTGADVEFDDFLVTTTGFDRKTVKAFLEMFIAQLAKKEP